MIAFHSVTLANGVVIDFIDRSNRYFGDYHRVCVDVRVTVPLPGEAAVSQAAGQPPLLQRVQRLERMAVPGEEVVSARDRLVADFLRHAGTYLARPAYPLRLAATSGL